MTIKQIPAFDKEEIAILNEAASIIQIWCNFTNCSYCPFKSLCGRPYWQDNVFSTDFQKIIDNLEAKQNANR